MQLLKTIALICVLAVVTAAAANAQIRTVKTAGSSNDGGSVHITIEDFGKPGRHDPIGPLSRPAALYDMLVTVLPGWTCTQTTTAIFNQMLATLPPVYMIQIAPTNSCHIYVTRAQEGSVVWNINVEVNVEGQTVDVEEGAVPVKATAWSYIKSQGWNRYH